MKRVLVVLFAAVVAAEQMWLLAPMLKLWVLPPIEDPAVAGRRVAERMGCFSCHGAEGAGGIENLGSDNKVVPALGGGEMMMWADSEEQLREWIVYGNPQDEDHVFERTGLAAGQGTERAIVMPPYDSHLSAAEVESLIAYLRSISGLQFPEDKRTQEGMDLAHRLGCFRCHGAMGTGGVGNPGSVKGSVPGFFGEDYAELVRDREEVREWLVSGVTARFEQNPVASAVIGHQALKMPAYGEFLEAEQIDSLVALVEWLAAGDWREVPVP
ncbi:MAG: c-type cytochrome [Myxococcales bacterium]|nr:MAG: c-type cytochrome [Myxococcales bacterium]